MSIPPSAYVRATLTTSAHDTAPSAAHACQDADPSDHPDHHTRPSRRR
ncbi:hypothetical protein [Streptomyces sp. NPDC046862]